MSEQAETVGARLRTLRKRLGMTQDQLATNSGLTRVDVARIENGYNQARSHRVVKGLAMAVGVDESRMGAYLAGSLSEVEILPTTQEPGNADLATVAAEAKAYVISMALCLSPDSAARRGGPLGRLIEALRDAGMLEDDEYNLLRGR